MWRFPEWPWRFAAERHQIAILAALIQQGIDPLGRWTFIWDDHEAMLRTAREVAAGD